LGVTCAIKLLQANCRIKRNLNNIKNKLNLTVFGMNLLKETKVIRDKQIYAYIRAILR
jgi:hypothetical protein